MLTLGGPLCASTHDGVAGVAAINPGAVHRLAQVRSVGVALDGQVAIPADIRDVGWFRWGSAPGATPGSVVLVGHLDSATQPGLGSLAFLRTLEARAVIRVTTVDGRAWTYRAVGHAEIPKDRLPLRDISRAPGGHA